MVIVSADGKIKLVNAQTESLFGYGRGDLIGLPVEVLVPERYRHNHPGHRSTYFGAPRARPMGAGLQLFALRKDGSEFPAEISLSPIETPEGQLVTAAIRDISERRKFEEIRRKSQELEEQNRRLELEEQNRRMQEANRLKSEFVANMSHELRTPLNSVIGFAELMYKEKVGPVSPGHKEYLNDILTSSKHLLQLINDVLDLAKVESGKIEFRPEVVDVGKVVTEVRDILRGLSAEKRTKVETLVNPELGEMYLDVSKLKQVLYNYLSNAIKFTPGRRKGHRPSDRRGRQDVSDRRGGHRDRCASRGPASAVHRVSAARCRIRQALCRNRSRPGPHETHRGGSRRHGRRQERPGKRQSVLGDLASPIRRAPAGGQWPWLDERRRAWPMSRS